MGRGGGDGRVQLFAILKCAAGCCTSLTEEREREREKRIINNYSLVDRFDWTRLINISPVPSLRGANLPSNLFAFPMADYCILLLG